MGMNYYLVHKDENKKFKIPSSLYSKNAGRLALQIYEKYDNSMALDWTKCIEETDRLHIGKSSSGWYFTLCIYPELDIYNLSDWNSLFNDSSYLIVNEEGTEVSKEDMISAITERKIMDVEKFESIEAFEEHCIQKHNEVESKFFENPKLFTSYDEYLESNHAYRGKFGLLGHKSTILDLRGDEKWKDFLPIISVFIPTDGTYDLTTDWDFS